MKTLKGLTKMKPTGKTNMKLKKMTSIQLSANLALPCRGYSEEVLGGVNFAKECLAPIFPASALEHRPTTHLVVAFRKELTQNVLCLGKDHELRGQFNDVI